MLQEGDPGDGRSVALWLDVQVLSHYDQKREERAKATYDRLLTAHETDPENVKAPTKEAPKDSIFNKGTFIGLGGFMMAQEKTAFLASHEG